MKALPRLASGVAVALLFAVGSRAAGEVKLAAEEFARGPAIQHAVLSRDGQTVAYIITFEKEERLRFHNLETNKTQGLIYPPQNDPLELGYSGFAWAGKDRAIFSLFHDGLSAMDATGKNYVGLAGEDRNQDQAHQSTGPKTIMRGVVQAPAGGEEGKILMNDYDVPIKGWEGQYFTLEHPNVAKVDTRTGYSARVVANSGSTG